MENLILDPSLLPYSGLMTEELFYLKPDKAVLLAAEALERVSQQVEVQGSTDRVEALPVLEPAPEAEILPLPVIPAMAPPQPAAVIPAAVIPTAVIPAPAQPASLSGTALRQLQSRGQYKKPLLFVSGSRANTTPAEAYVLLENILKALNLSIEDIALLEVEGYAPVELGELIAAYKPRMILSFGADHLIQGWPAVLVKNEPLKLDQIMFLKAVSLQTLMQEKSEKGGLWLSLKILFKIP